VASDKTVSVLIDTAQTATESDQCKLDCTGGGTTTTDENGNVLSQSHVPEPGTCGNSFRRPVTVTENWELYLLPFDSFYQDRLPNMAPEGLDPTSIYHLTIRAEKEARLELWIDDIGFYRPR
jgi:hypothetical protein